MDSFSISQLQQFSGIKAHTIRIWEQRYDALKPNRSEGNTRYYDNSQLRRLLNITSLMNDDYKVSELCRMSDSQLFKLLEEQLKNPPTAKEPYEYFVTQLVAAGMEYDEAHFEKLFSACIIRFGIRQTYINVVYPLLLRLGLMWTNDRLPPAQEHFISNIIRQKLFTAIDSLPPAKSVKDTWLLFLPENEFHEIGLLFAHYTIRHAGKRSVYLGANVPDTTLKDAITIINPSNLLLFFVHHNIPEESQKYLNWLSKSFKETTIHLSGNVKLIKQLKTGKEIQWLQSVEQLEKRL